MHFLKTAKHQNVTSMPKHFSWEMKLDVQRWLILWDHGKRSPPRLPDWPSSSHFVQQRILPWKAPWQLHQEAVGEVCNTVEKWQGTVCWNGEKRQQQTHIPRGYGPPFHWQHWHISLLIAVWNSLFCIVPCAIVWKRFLCFEPVSFPTDHTPTKHNMIHKEVRHYCHSNVPPPPPFFSNMPLQ